MSRFADPRSPHASIGHGSGAVRGNEPDTLHANGHRPARARSRRRAAKIALRGGLDLGILSGAIWLAYLLRYEGVLDDAHVGKVMLAWPWVVGLQYLCFVLQKVPRFAWSLISVRETLPILRATGTAAALLLLVRYGGGPLVERAPAVGHVVVPASVIVIDAILALLGIVGVRTLRRLQVETRRRRRHDGRPPTRTLLVGAGRAGSLVARELELRPELGIRPVGFVDDDPNMRAQMVQGIPVLGTILELPELAERTEAEVALVTIAAINRRTMQRIFELCKSARLQTKIIPRVDEILEGRVKISQIRDVAIEDLLGRASVEIENSVAPAVVNGKSILVTGAGGSIGSELCRQILALGPATLVLVDRTENSLYEIHRELAPLAGDIQLVPAIADICDLERMRALFDRWRPLAVFHAAAHKHVPMMEYNPGEAIKNNVFGTKNVADLALHFGAERFVLISTDKAVNPTSVMGATKRLAELYINGLDARGLCRFASVRFGNVLSSAGSVIPLFREQISRGGPVTVTHPDMERFFMTIPEASRLVLEAAGLCRGGEVLVLDMGEPIRIATLAEQMIRLSGFEPGADIEIVYTGIRPGEKLSEELVQDGEDLEPTSVGKIYRWHAPASPVSMATAIEVLGQPCSDAREAKLRLASVLSEYRGLEPPPAPPRRPILRLPVPLDPRGPRKSAAPEPAAALVARRAGLPGDAPGRASGA